MSVLAMWPGRSQLFEPDEDTEYYTATLRIRLVHRSGVVRSTRDEDLRCVADRAAAAAAGAYAFHNTWIGSVVLESIEESE